MPTGTALRDARTQLLAAATRVLARDGAGALTSRAITDEAGVAKGLLHRYFTDVDDLLVALVGQRTAQLEEQGARLRDAAGSGTVVANVSRALTEAIDPVAVGLIGLAISRDELRRRLRRAGHGGLPTVTATTAMLSAYLAAERALGRLVATAEPDALARTLVGTGHLLLAGELGATPDPGAVDEIVETALVGALRGPAR